MRLRQIEVFHAVYSSGSMTNAAALLNVSQPSISKVLAHAEQQLGFKLFERGKGRLIPTPEAHQLFKHVSDVFHDIDRLKHVARNLRVAEAGRIRIASTPAFGIELLPKAIASFQDNYPDMLFEIETLHLNELNNALLESRVDLGLAFDPISQPGVTTLSLAKGRFVVIAPMDTDFGGATELTVDELQGHRFIGLNNRGPLGRLLSTYLATSNVEFNVVAWTETYHVAKALVACRAGIAIIDEITARSATGGQVQIMALAPALRFDIKALHLGSTPLSIAAMHFLAHIEGVIADYVVH